MGRHRTPAELAAIRGKQIRGRADNAGNRIDPTTMGVVRHGGAGMPIRDPEAPRHPSLWPIEYSGWSRSAVARTVRDMFSSDEFQSSPEDHARNEAVQSAQIQRSRNRSRSPIAGTSRNIISADSDDDIQQDITDHDLGIMADQGVMDQDVQALQASGTGTGGNAGDQSTMRPIAVPIYRDLSGNLHGFNKRWFFVLPVVNPSVISTIGGGGAAQRNMFYFPGAFDFDPNLLGWYATGGDIEFIKQLTSRGTTTCRVKDARMVGTITAINSPFNTQATNQGTANGQLHLTGYIGKNLNKAGLTTVATCKYTSQQAGSHNITGCTWNGTLNTRAWFDELERTTLSGTADPNTTSGIYVVSQPDATEGYRYYPQQFGYKCLVNAGRVVTDYSDFMRDTTVVQVGPGELFKLGGKRSAFLSLQSVNADINNQMYTGIGTNTAALSSMDGSMSETLAQREWETVTVQPLSRIVDNNATVENKLQMSGPTLKPSLQFGMIPSPTTTDTVTTAQVAYVQLVVDTSMDLEFTLDHYKSNTDTGSGSTIPTAQLLRNNYAWHRGLNVGTGGASTTRGMGNGMYDYVDIGNLQRKDNVLMRPANNYTSINP